jgi:hypothetical protein
MADISAFEGLQNQANEAMGDPVFNAEFKVVDKKKFESGDLKHRAESFKREFIEAEQKLVQLRKIYKQKKEQLAKVEKEYKAANPAKNKSLEREYNSAKNWESKYHDDVAHSLNYLRQGVQRLADCGVQATSRELDVRD